MQQCRVRPPVGFLDAAHGFGRITEIELRAIKIVLDSVWLPQHVGTRADCGGNVGFRHADGGEQRRNLAIGQVERLQRLQDDKKQLDLLGKPVDLSFTATDGTKVDLAQQHGHVTAVIFWSSESAPSLVWLGYFAKFANEVPSLRVVTVSLDRNQADLTAAMNSLNITWPTAFDGKGWQNSIAREFGINTIPTLWLIDKKGRLAFLNARDSYELKIRELFLKN